MSKRLFILLTFFVVLGLIVPNVVFADVLEIPIAEENDDVEERADGSMYFDSSDLEMIYDNDPTVPDDLQTVGMRFLDVQIPKGANIMSATVRFDADDVDDAEHVGDAYVIIEGELSPNAGAFEDIANNVTARAKTTAQVAWGPVHWSEQHAKYETPDIASIIQEITSQDGWASGNALVLIVSQDPANASTGVAEAESFKDNATDNIDRRPTLLIEFAADGAPPAGGAGADGLLLIEYWNNIDGTTIADLTGNANYPDSPDEQDILMLFDRPYDRPAPNNDNYGALIRGYLHPPETGDYTFWIASDDASDFYLSTNDDPANAVLVAEIGGWCPAYDWDNTAGSDNPNQVSDPVTLEGGQKYYVEAVYKEGGGGDGFAAAWQGPGIPDRVVISGDYLSSVALPASVLKAKSPNPTDGAVDVEASSLEWAPGPTSVSYKVYLSTDDTIEESELVAETDLTIHLTDLDDGATYYWRVDAVDADGAVYEGDDWSFSTLPLEAHFPNPADGAKSQAVDAKLSWTGGKDVIMHDLYFGTDEALVAAGDPSMFKGKLMVTSYDPGALDLETTYYWKVDEFSVTGTNAGPLWSFTTLGAVEITDPDLLLYYDFESGEGTVVIDQSGHSNHGQFMGSPEWATGIFGGAVSIDLATIDYIEAAPLGITSNNITVAGWVFHEESPAPWSGILTHRGSGNLGLQHDGTELRYMWGPDLYWSFSSGLQIPNGEWYFAALTISPDQGKLYLNGIEQTAINVAPHDPVNFDSVIYVGADIGNSTGRVQTSLIDEVRLYNKTLSDAEILKLAKPHIADVTAPGDVVQGIPTGLPCGGDPSANYSPCGELPPLVIDNDVSTKYLNFGGNFDPDEAPSGFQVTPSSGPSIVTGLTFTTANDAEPRDPIAFGLYGSNDSIDGPYELIASGDIVDFAQVDAWPRFTMNATPIMFDNTTAYTHYQVLFTALRDEANANSMQIAEVELLGVPAPVGHWPLDGDAVDASGNGNDGVLMGDPQFVAGMVGGAVDLDGVDDYIDCGNSELLNITGEMTVAAWIKVDLFDKDWQAIITHGDNSWRIHRSSGSDNIAWGTSGLDPTDLTGTTNVNDGEWHHVAGVYTGSQKLLYIDGALDASSDSTGSIGSSTYNVNIGENNQATGRYFDGLIDDVRIYNKGLHALQIRDLMAPPPTGANIILVTRTTDEDADGIYDDQGLVDWLVAEGHNVDVQRDYWVELDDAKIAALNAADLIIVSRGSASGDYDEEGEPTQWNSIETPMILMNAYLLRTTRWSWLDSTSAVQLDFPIMEAVLPDHAIFEGVAVDADNIVLAIDGAVGSGQTTFVTADNVGNGTLIAQSIDGVPWIVRWEAGVEFFDGAGQVPAAPRLLYTNGTQEPPTWGEQNLTEDGLQILRNAINMMLAPPAAAAAGFSDDFDRADGDLGNGWSTRADGTIEVKIVDNEVLIAGEQATDWERSGLSRDVGDETKISFDFKGDDNFNVHVRLDDVGSGAFLEIYTWGGPLIHANSEDGSWPGWTDIVGSEIMAGEYNNLVLEQIGTDFVVTLNGVVVATLTNTALTDIGSVLFSSDSAAGTVGSIRIDNVVLSGP